MHRSEQIAASRQAAYWLWLPPARRFLCIAHMPCLLPTTIRTPATVLVTSSDRDWLDTLHRWALPQGSEVRSLSDYEPWPEAVDAAVVFGLPPWGSKRLLNEVIEEYIGELEQVWRSIRPGGRVLVGLETGWHPRRLLYSPARSIRMIRLSGRLVGAVHSKLVQWGYARLERLHAFPSLDRPLIVAPVAASGRTKGLAIRHVGARLGPLMAGILAPRGRLFLWDLLPPAVVFVAEKPDAL